MLKHTLKAIVITLCLLPSSRNARATIPSTQAFRPPFQLRTIPAFPGIFYEKSARDLLHRFECFNLSGKIKTFLEKRIIGIATICTEKSALVQYAQEFAYASPTYWEQQTLQDDTYWLLRALTAYGQEYADLRLQLLCQCRKKKYHTSMLDMNALLDTLEAVDEFEFIQHIATKFGNNGIKLIRLIEFGNLACALLNELEKDTLKIS
jgi:hypothetical protein